MSQGKITAARLCSDQGRDGGDEGAGEDVALDEIYRAESLLVSVILDGYGLHERQTVGFEQFANLSEVSIELARSNRFHHFDRDEPVIPAAQIAIVIEKYGHAAIETGRSYALASQGMLLARNRGCRDMTAVVRCGVYRKTTPA